MTARTVAGDTITEEAPPPLVPAASTSAVARFTVLPRSEAGAEGPVLVSEERPRFEPLGELGPDITRPVEQRAEPHVVVEVGQARALVGPSGTERRIASYKATAMATFSAIGLAARAARDRRSGAPQSRAA